MTKGPTEFLDFACTMADAAAERLLDWFGRATSTTKRDGTLVTQADLEVDGLTHELIGSRYASHGVLSEETSLIYEGNEYTWVIDPLDGTTNFANGLSYWGTSIALLHHGEPMVGLMDFPLLGQRFEAMRGHGATMNGRVLQVRPSRALHSNLFFTTDSRAFRYLDIDVDLKPRILGSAAYDLAAVAAGMSVACVQTTPKVWDLAAAWLVDRESGVTIAPLLEGPTLFPLQQGQDYTGRVFPVLAAIDEDLWQRIRRSIRIRAEARPRARHLEAQGWRINPGA